MVMVFVKSKISPVMITNKKEIQNLIPTAMEAIVEVGIANEDREIEDVYEGYINALGPSILQSGLLPTLVFYNKGKGGNSEGELCLWLKALYYMDLSENERQNITNWQHVEPTEIIRKVINGKGGEIKSISVAREWEKKILQYVIALKLATRTFIIKEKKGGGKR